MGLNLTHNYSINFSIPKRSKKMIKFIIIHYTGMKSQSKAIKKLCDSNSKVSAHYFIKNDGKLMRLVPDLYDQWQQNPTSSLGIVRTYPWHIKDSAILIGDSAHATVPFYGQGMNCGFEDCRVFNNLLDQYNNDIENCFEKFSKIRKPNGDGVQDLSMHNFVVMRDKTADPLFLLQKKIEKKFSNLYPEKWTPLYSMVSFTNISYSEAWKLGQKQEKIMQKVMKTPNINSIWDNDEIMTKIDSLL